MPLSAEMGAHTVRLQVTRQACCACLLPTHCGTLWPSGLVYAGNARERVLPPRCDGQAYINGMSMLGERVLLPLRKGRRTWHVKVSAWNKWQIVPYYVVWTEVRFAELDVTATLQTLQRGDTTLQRRYTTLQ